MYRPPSNSKIEDCITFKSFPTLSTVGQSSALSWVEQRRPSHQPVAGFAKDPFLNPASSGDVGGLPDIVTQVRTTLSLQPDYDIKRLSSILHLNIVGWSSVKLT